MFSLQDLLGPQQGEEAVQQISQNVGAEPGLVNGAIQMALPAILSGLARHASTPSGAESLNNALEQHDGGILDNIGNLGSMIFGGGQPTPQTDAGGILGHIFGSNQGQVAQTIGNQSGLNTGQTAQILMMLAPIVLGYLAKQKQEKNLDAGGLSNMLGQQQEQMQASGNPIMNTVTSMLDRDHDGSTMDDIASMAMNYFRNR
jgi:hypothetical protein